MLTVPWQTKSTVSFLHGDKHGVNEHHVIRKSHDATQKKSVLTWCISMYHVISWNQKRWSEDGEKFRGCRGLLGGVINDQISSFCEGRESKWSICLLYIWESWNFFRLLAVCFSLEISAGITKTAIPPCVAIFSTGPTSFAFAMTKRSS